MKLRYILAATLTAATLWHIVPPTLDYAREIKATYDLGKQVQQMAGVLVAMNLPQQKKGN